jgi:transcriptional regulator with XRE-family HTH domain
VLVDNLIAPDHRSRMAKQPRARPGEGIPADVKQAEGRALHALWKKRKRRTQAEFAMERGFTQGYLPQFFAGLRPLTLELATAFAEELGVEVGDFSPRLAEDFHAALVDSEWPFRGFTRAEFATLSKGQRHAVEQLIVGYLIDSGAISSRALRKLG